jgi:dTDP-4-amino-4,6-dideoxygalactose transaminase
MTSYIPYARQDISQQDIDAVVEVLRSDWLTQGPTIERFEEAVATYCGAKYAVAVSSATAGLHLACLGLGLGQGDILGHHLILSWLPLIVACTVRPG